MGTYTTVGVSATVKPAYRDAVGLWLATHSENPSSDRYYDGEFGLRRFIFACFVTSFAEDPVRDRVLLDITEYAKIDRHTWIPFAGVHHSILDQWWSKHNEFDPKTGKWVFTASVKNYDSVIEKFLTLVLWHLVEGEHLIQVEVEPYGHQRSIDTLRLQPNGALSQLETDGNQDTDYETLLPAEQFQ